MNDRRTILVVDDEPGILEALRRTLKVDGYRVLTASGGKEALAILEHEPVHILISDIEMPEMKGLELLARVREQWPEVVRIVLTGRGSFDSAIDAINEGEVHRFLTKPWSNDVLLQTLRATVVRLPELRAPAQLDPKERAQETLRRELEGQYPGILEVPEHASAYVVDDERLSKVLRAMDDVSRARFRATSLSSTGVVTRIVLVPQPE